MTLQYDPTSGYLIPGLHQASWSDMTALCELNAHRSRLVSGLRAAALNLRGAGCGSILLDGSFVSQKELPNDYDGAWSPVGVDPNLVDPVLLTFDKQRAAMKAKYGGELFISFDMAAPGILFEEFFQTDRNGNAKGILSLDLGSIK